MTINDTNSKRPFIDLYIKGQKTRWLADSGAVTTVANDSFFEQFKTSCILLKTTHNKKVVGASGTEMRVTGVYLCPLRIGETKFWHPIICLSNLRSQAIAGMDMMRRLGIIIDTANNKVVLPNLKKEEVSSIEEIVVPANSTKLVKVRAAKASCDRNSLFIPDDPSVTADGILTLHDKDTCHIPIWNSSAEPLHISRGERMGTIQSAPELVAPTPARQIVLEPLSGQKRKYILDNLQYGSHLTEQEREQLTSLILKYHQAFSANEYDLGHTDVLKHTIKLKDDEPRHVKQFRIPWEQQQHLNDLVTKLLDKKVIKESTSSYNSPIFLVKKKSGNFRAVLDYRQLNEATVKHKYVIRTSEQCIDEVSKNSSTIFASLDLTSGFFQQALDEESQEYTAFTVPGRGRYMWLVVPQGLHGSPASFARLMDFVTSHPKRLPGIISFIDDLLAHAKTFTDLLLVLEQCFKRLILFGLKLNIKKCIFARKQVPYLGFIISDKGVLPGDDKLQAVERFPAPKSVKAVREFLGLTNFFRQFIHNYTADAAYLSALTRKDSSWKGGELPEEALRAFKSLKEKLCSKPLLAYPRADKTFHLATDAATGDDTHKGGLGAVLMQDDDYGKRHVVAYASRSLKQHEENYSPYLLEMTAASWAIDHFDTYLRGVHFKLYSDHKPLQGLVKKQSKTLKRLQEQMLDFDFEVIYTKGTDNTAPDALSRNPVDDISAINAAWDRATGRPDTPLHLNEQQLRILQRGDLFCFRLWQMLQTGYVHGTSAQELKRLRLIADSCFIDNGILYYSWKKKGFEPKQLYVVPKSYHKILLTAAHASPLGGHGGVFHTLQRILTRYWWPGLQKDVETFIRQCRTCLEFTNPARFRSSHQTHQPLPIPEGPNQVVHMDLAGPYKTPDGNKKYLLVLTDGFSKHTVLTSIPNKSAAAVADAIFEKYISIFSCPLRLISDNGPEFCAQLQEKLFAKLGIVHSKTSTFRPQCNGRAEIFNKTAIRYLSKFCDGDTLDWEKWLSSLQLCYNSHVHSATLQSPFFLTFLHEPSLPYFDLEEPKPLYNEDWATAAYERLKEAYRITVANLHRAEEARQIQTDKTAADKEFRIGDRVLLYTPSLITTGQNQKFMRHWDSFWIVTEKVHKANYIIERMPGHARRGKNRLLVHVDRIKKDTSPVPPPQTRLASSPPSPNGTLSPKTRNLPANRPDCTTPTIPTRNRFQPLVTFGDNVPEEEHHVHEPEQDFDVEQNEPPLRQSPHSEPMQPDLDDREGETPPPSSPVTQTNASPAEDAQQVARQGGRQQNSTAPLNPRTPAQLGTRLGEFLGTAAAAATESAQSTTTRLTRSRGPAPVHPLVPSRPLEYPKKTKK